MQKRIIISIIIVFILFVAGVFLLPKLSQDAKSIQTIDINDITKIELKKAQTVLGLQKNDSGQWMLDNETPADEDIMSLLLIALQNFQPAGFITKDATDSIFQNDAATTTITLWKESMLLNFKLPFKQKLKTLHIHYSATSNNFLIKVNHQNEAYFVAVPGINKNSLAVLLNSDKKMFHSRNIFDLQFYQIKYVQMEWTDHPEKSFTIKQDKNFLQVYALSGSPIDFDTVKVMNYLASFTAIYHNGFVDNPVLQNDTLSFRHPAEYSLKIIDNENNSYTIQTIPIYLNKQEKDPDQLYAKINDKKEYVYLQYFLIDAISKSISYFQQ